MPQNATGDKNNVVKLPKSFTKQASGIFTWVLGSDVMYCDGSAAESFGFSLNEVSGGLPARNFLSRLHPEDLPGVSTAIQDAISTGMPYQEDYRICRPDGSVLEVTTFGSCFCDTTGKPVHFAGIVVPVQAPSSLDSDLITLCLQAYGIAKRTGRLDAASKIIDVLVEIAGQDAERKFRNIRLRRCCRKV
ncbi:MAG: diguanylate cyclase [Rhizobium sp.]|nr:diguanylate cyclase [Rhizobium sp.]